jgi:hypothetical protein
MILNYHEMTMNEPRNSPAKRQQFLVICTVMVAMFVYSAVTSGALLSIDPVQGVFPGGNYIYKSAARDYAASPSLARHIRKEDLQFTGPESVGDELMYYLFLDDPSRMGGRRQRFMTGMLMGTVIGEEQEEKEQEYMETLLSKNPALLAKPLQKEDYVELSAMELWARLPYETADLPSVDALVLHFPFTNGFVSALILGYKVRVFVAVGTVVQLECQFFPSSTPPPWMFLIHLPFYFCFPFFSFFILGGGVIVIGVSRFMHTVIENTGHSSTAQIGGGKRRRWKCPSRHYHVQYQG